jgi:LAGLIDADG-like domain
MAPRYRLVNALDAADAAYIAGLVDGEGTVTLSRLHRKENRRLVVCISNNDLALLQHVQAKIGAGQVTSKRVYSLRHAPSFNYHVNSRQALELLRQIVAYMRSYKVDRAKLALQHYLRLTPRNGRYTPDAAAARREFETALLAIRPR